MRVAAAILISLVAISGCARAQEASSTVTAKKSAGCKTALDLIASQNPNLPMHPVFQEILNSPSLKGTLFVPTAKAWDSFFATIRQRQGNPEAPAMVARYGQVMLYHLAQDVGVPIATPTPGANKFAFDTASTLQCSVGPSLPNNRVVVKKTPQAILLEHGTGNATIVSQPISYCGGEAYLVDQVLVPCSDVAAIMGEIANVPSPCKNNVEGVLQRNGLSYYNALLLATGVNRPIFSGVRNWTLFTPTDAAVQEAYASGAFDYPEMFARNKSLLTGVVAFHAVPQIAHTAPSTATLTMGTLLADQGNASCANPALSWRQDGYVYGGSGNARVSNTYDRGCAAVIFQINNLLQPCCKPMSQLLGSIRTAKGSMTEKALNYLQSQMKENAGRTSFVLPTEAAWQALLAEAAAVNLTLGEPQLSAIMSYLYTGAEVADVVDAATPVKTALSLSPTQAKAICRGGSNATMIFAYDTGAPADAGVVPAGAAPATAAPATAAPMTAAPMTAAPATAAPMAAAPMAPGPMGPAAPMAPMAAGPMAPGPMAPAAPAAAFPAAAPLAVRRRLSQTKLPTTATNLLLPTSATAAAAAKRKGSSVLQGPVMVVDGAAVDLRSGVGIPVTSITYGCDGAVYHVNAVPLPCNLLGRTVMRAPPPMAAPLPLSMTISSALVNTTDIPGAVPNTTAASGAGGARALVGSGAAAVLLAAMLL